MPLTHMLIVCSTLDNVIATASQRIKTRLDADFVKYSNFLADNIFFVEELNEKQISDIEDFGYDCLCFKFDFGKDTRGMLTNKKYVQYKKLKDILCLLHTNDSKQGADNE